MMNLLDSMQGSKDSLCVFRVDCAPECFVDVSPEQELFIVTELRVSKKYQNKDSLLSYTRIKNTMQSEYKPIKINVNVSLKNK